ncbi:SOS response-associated peptidase [Fodinisporobacter ferrooxydans]|uniref:Abasic site processing protein n=1 Tax=Fodinisporobacter ferrooxydans TaxID=2901836 RepID=A0ABY4CJY3_9BACL|nr:SOS response-associated peptidase [Alicyclobacillaceae bacterium MYW30-H2]
MCGRFPFTNPDELAERYHLTDIPADIKPRYNISPGQLVTAIIHEGTNNRVGQLQWGLIPSWAKDEKIAYRTINAKAETLLEKSAFKVPFIRKRYIIPADGFYEWKRVNGDKQPLRILMKDKRIQKHSLLHNRIPLVLKRSNAFAALAPVC